MVSRLPVVALFFCVVACAPPNPLELGPAANAGPVECDSGCAVQWQRAQVWINKHAKMKIQNATDVIVQTYTPTSHLDQWFSFTAQREPLGGQRYRITLAAVCTSGYGCSETSEDVAAAFYYYVATGMDILVGRTLRSIQ